MKRKTEEQPSDTSRITTAASQAGGVVVLYDDASSPARDDALAAAMALSRDTGVPAVLIDADVLRSFLLAKAERAGGPELLYVSPQQYVVDPELIPPGAILCVHDGGLPTHGPARRILYSEILPTARHVVYIAYGAQLPAAVEDMGWPTVRC